MHIRHRPKNMEDVLGNKPTKKAIEGLLYDRPILLEGTRGCGKTTIALILANKFVESENNIRVINCRHESQVANMRDTVDSFRKSSIFGNKKAYIFDEIHQLSPASQGELLAELEDSLPKDVLIVACTTTTKGMDVPLLERFIRLPIKPLNMKDSLILLDRISSLEEINLPKWLSALICEKAEGIPRNILTSLAKVRNIDNPEEAEYLIELSKLEDIDEGVLTLFKIIRNEDWFRIRGTLESCLRNNKPEIIRVGLLNLIGARLMSKYLTNKEEASRLLKHYNVLSENRFPEKANLIYTVCKCTME
uniref:Putative DNA polymerase n=1 Tax=viral metagenome TaxID=1070528 RepID=A0A6M3LD65_9ZZZZ